MLSTLCIADQPPPSYPDGKPPAYHDVCNSAIQTAPPSCDDLPSSVTLLQAISSSNRSVGISQPIICARPQQFHHSQVNCV